LLDLISLRTGDLGSAQTDGIYASNVAVDVNQHEWRDIPEHAGVAGNHGPDTNPHKLVNNGPSAEKRTHVHTDVTAEQDSIDEHDLVADSAIVADMAARQQEAPPPHNGRGAGAGPPVNGDVLTNDGPLTDAAIRLRSFAG